MKRFVIQHNLISETDMISMKHALVRNKIPYEEVKVVPFTKELPKFIMDEDNIYYGSTTFIANLYEQLKPKGVFFDPKKFLISNYIDQWGKYMLNDGADICSIPEFIKRAEKEYGFKDDHKLFIRPDADDKSFDGQVMTFGEIKNWKENLIQYDNTKSLLEIDVVVAEPYNIRKEWRNFIVNEKIVTSSLYRKDFKLNKSAIDIPLEMLDFVQNRIVEYQPASAFAIDIALCGDEYYIIECGCINSVGFYHGDIEKILLAL